MESLPTVIIIELGSQYTLVIERANRELGVRSVILDPKGAQKWLVKHHHQVKAIILSGGAASVSDKDAPQLPLALLDLIGRVPVLGICYGMQKLAEHFGGKVAAVSGNREYGDANIVVTAGSRLFAGTGREQKVWASHGDTVTALPQGYVVTAVSSGDGIGAMENAEGTVFGVQFHPEVTHTPEGKRILANFLFEIAGCAKDWQPGAIVEGMRERLNVDIASSERAVIGFSGGVDSTFLAAVAAPVLGERLLAITIDGGHLREDELNEIALHADSAGIKYLRIIDARADFEAVMAGTIDAEEKRRRFKEVYTRLLRREAEDFGASVILQGTLAPDRIESGATGGALIKSHHNVGLNFGNLQQAHPIDHLFKYEVRALARDLGLPASVWTRQPFPGPGGFLRINGMPATQDILAIWQWCQARVEEILKRRGIYDSLSQLVVHILGVKMVGVKGDARKYAYPAVVRAIQTVDFMTAKGVHFDEGTQDEIEQVLTRHPEIVCVMFNSTDKPPATTEPE